MRVIIDIPDDEYDTLIEGMESKDDYSLYWRLDAALLHVPWITQEERELILEHIPN